MKWPEKNYIKDNGMKKRSKHAKNEIPVRNHWKHVRYFASKFRPRKNQVFFYLFTVDTKIYFTLHNNPETMERGLTHHDRSGIPSLEGFRFTCEEVCRKRWLGWRIVMARAETCESSSVLLRLLFLETRV